MKKRRLLTSTDVRRALQDLIHRHAAGEIDDAMAHRQGYLLNITLKACYQTWQESEMLALAKRLGALERQIYE